MGIVFIEWQEGKGDVGPVLMGCGQTWGERFVRLSEFVSREYNHPSIYFFGGQVENDYIYVNIPTMQSLFERVVQNRNYLLIGWAEQIAGMLEVATQIPLYDVWPEENDRFRPRTIGVSLEDIPVRKARADRITEG